MNEKNKKVFALSFCCFNFAFNVLLNKNNFQTLKEYMTNLTRKIMQQYYSAHCVQLALFFLFND